MGEGLGEGLRQSGRGVGRSDCSISTREGEELWERRKATRRERRIEEATCRAREGKERHTGHLEPKLYTFSID